MSYKFSNLSFSLNKKSDKKRNITAGFTSLSERNLANINTHRHFLRSVDAVDYRDNKMKKFRYR